MRNNQNPKQRKKIHKTYLYLKKRVFFCVLFFIAIIGLLFPLRPKTSTIEKRTLTTFPKFSLSSFWNGEYFENISTWYSDTFPFREALLSANSKFESLYGIQGEQIIHNSSNTGDEIPEDGMMVPSSESENQTTEQSENNEQSQNESTSDETNQTESESETYEDGAIHTVPEASGDVYVAGDTAFGIYYFNLDGANAYINMIDKAQKRLDGVANVYDILVPTSVGVCLDEKAQEKINSSNQKDAINYITSNINKLNNKVKTVEVFDTLKNHNSEYIYFRTDHHWTALGAYYAYEEFCNVKGITPTSIESYEKVEYPNFVGSFYASSNQVSSLKENPDTVVGYIPQSTNDMFFIDQNGQRVDWRIVNDVSDYDTGAKYSAFAAADQMYAQIDNPKLSDGSSCVVIKESYGNAFIPFLVDHYQHVYIVDYRYFYKYSTYNNSIYQLVTQNNVNDVIFINNADAMTNANQVKLMSEMFN